MGAAIDRSAESPWKENSKDGIEVTTQASSYTTRPFMTIVRDGVCLCRKLDLPVWLDELDNPQE